MNIQRFTRGLLFFFVALAFTIVPAFSQSTTVVISQLYSAQAAAPHLKNDFVELFNLGTTTVDLSGWSVQTAAQGNSEWSGIALSGSIAPGQYYLVSGSIGLSGGDQIALPKADVSGTLALDAGSGKVALVNSTEPLTFECPKFDQTVVDLASWGNATSCVSPAIAFDGLSGLVRKRGGCIDTDSSNADFTVASPLPRTIVTPRSDCNTADTAAQSTLTVPSNGGTLKTTTGASSAINVGSARLELATGGSTPSGLAIFGFRQSGNLVSEATVPAAKAIRSALLYVEANGTINTGVAVTNPNSFEVRVNFAFNDASRAAYYPTNFGSFTLPPNGQISRFINELPFTLPPGIQGTLELNATGPVGIIALRSFINERNDFLVTTLPVIDLSQPLSTDPTFLAHFAAEGGWRTNIFLVNYSGVTATGTLDFTDPSGNPVTVPFIGFSASSVEYTLAAKSSLTVTLSGSQIATTTKIGVVKINPTGGSATPTAIAVFGYRRNGITVSEAGLVAARGSRFRTYVEASGTPGAAGSIQSSIAIGNASASSAASVDLELTRLDGTSTGLKTTVTVPAAGQISRFLNELFPTVPASFQGVMRLTTSGQVTLIGFRNRINDRNDYLFTTVPAVDETAPASTADVIFPHVPDSAGYTTQFVVFGAAGSASSGTLRSFNQAGLPLALPFQ